MSHAPDHLNDFDFHLPTGAAARAPLPARDGGKLVVVHRGTGKIEHRKVTDLPEYLAGELVYGNDAKVNKLRVMLRLETGHEVESLFLKALDPDRTQWGAFVRLPLEYEPGRTVELVDGTEVLIVYRSGSEAVLEADQPVDLEVVGTYPLPVWCPRPPEPVDWTRYEPLYARRPGGQARASAGAQLSEEILSHLQLRTLTLWVDHASFDGISKDLPIQEHRMHEEAYEIPQPPGPGRQVVAIGSTALRALEAWARNGQATGVTDLFVRPPFEPKVVKGFFTNLHFPLESVLVMTCGFGGHELVMKAYKECAEKGYKFGDWGDSMLIL